VSFPFELAQTRFAQHQLVVHGDEGAGFLWVARDGADHVRHHAEFLDALGPVFLQVFLGGITLRQVEAGEVLGLGH
jgi:hypothetical protein